MIDEVLQGRKSWHIEQGDCLDVLRQMPDESVHCVVTSPPYWGLRDYGVDGQIGLESELEAYLAKLVEVFAEVRRVLRKDGTLWLNLGDSYNGSGGAGGDYAPGGLKEGQPRYLGRRVGGLKPKDLCGIPWRVALALQADGWYLRSDIIWAKPNPMPESVTDRPTRAHEYVFLLTKSPRYLYDADSIAEPAVYAGDARHLRVDHTQEHRSPKQDGHGRRYEGFNSRYFTGKPQADTRNKRTVWNIATRPYADAHFATFPPDLVRPCVLAGSPEDGVVLDPFNGSGTTGLVALRHGRRYVGIELNPEYVEMSRRRIEQDAPLFNTVEVV